MAEPVYLHLPLPTPLRRRFDYLPPEGTDPDQVRHWPAGIRIRVPFGKQELIGILLGVSDHTHLKATQLRPALERLDETPLWPDELLQLCRSEEHTSELQSRGHLVCRLLLEKKKHRRV